MNTVVTNLVLHEFLPPDTNECTDGTANCQQTCTNTQGSFQCNCTSGYTLDSNGRACNGEPTIDQVWYFISSPFLGTLIHLDHNHIPPTWVKTPAASSSLAAVSLLPNAKLCHVTAIRFTTFIFRISLKTCQQRNKGMSTPEMNSSYLFLPCSDINECDSNNGGCDHRCVNEPGSFRCECRTGFDLASNGTTCIGKLWHLFHIIRGKCSETLFGRGVAVCLQACSSLGEFEGSCMYNFCFIFPSRHQWV